MSRERRIGLFCGVLSVLLFSSFTLVSRLGFSSRLQLVDLAALRFGIGGTLLLPALLRADLRSVGWRQAAALALLGGLGFALPAYAGFSLAPAAHGAVLLHGTLPIPPDTLGFLLTPGRSSQSGPTPVTSRAPSTSSAGAVNAAASIAFPPTS